MLWQGIFVILYNDVVFENTGQQKALGLDECPLLVEPRCYANGQKRTLTRRMVKDGLQVDIERWQCDHGTSISLGATISPQWS